MTINTTIEQRRQDYLDALYILDGRDFPNHPHHATYTGLYTEHVAQVLARDVDKVLSLINPAP